MPNSIPTSLKSLLKQADYSAPDGKFIVPFGLTEENKILAKDMAEIPHILIGGTTGCGKTTFIQTLLCALISQYGPTKFKLMIYDSKTIDYISFNGLPHLLIPIVTDYRKAAGALNWACAEAMRRLQAIKDGESLENIPHIFFVMDDFSDLSKDEYAIEALYHLLKIGRATKIHCIISTGLPLAKIIPTELKILIPCRIAFSTVTKQASRVILDVNGAESLNSPGEMILKLHSELIKCKCAYASEDEIETFVDLAFDIAEFDR